MKGEVQRYIPDSYWVRPGLFLAGEYPSSAEKSRAMVKARALVEGGIRFVVDLTENGEYGLRPYLPFLLEEADLKGVEVLHRRMAVPDLEVPPVEAMAAILDEIDTAILAERPVYVHCFGGIGRTGTVVGCHLVRHGRSGEEALDQIALWRDGTPDGERPSPETDEQRAMVIRWEQGR